MIWIVGEYAERIDNADELLESFLEGFHDESTQVKLQCFICSLFMGWTVNVTAVSRQYLSIKASILG